VSERIQRRQSQNISRSRPQQKILAEISESFRGGPLEEDSMEVAFLMLEAMERACSGIADITAVQASFLPDSDRESGSPMVEWRWKRDTQVTAFFSIDKGPPLSVSTVNLFGTGRAEVDRRLWKKTELKWMVAEITHLRSLFLLVHRAFPTAKSNFNDLNIREPLYRPTCLTGCQRG
jgi:hypothetical protein